MLNLKCNLKFNNNPNLNPNPNPNPNLYSNLYIYIYINLNVDPGYPWSTASQFSRVVVIHGYPRLQFTFVCLNVAILNIFRGFLAARRSAFLGLLSLSAI